MEKSLLQTSEELNDYLQARRQETNLKIREEEAELFEESKTWSFIAPPLYLLYSETEEELQNPTTLFYHISSIINRKKTLVVESDFLSKEDTAIMKEDLIVLSLDLLQRMGANSAFGDVMDANIDIDYNRIILKDKFVVKIPKDSSMNRQRSVRNEFIIGYYGVNYLRRLVPNFIYTYGYFECGRPTEDDFCSVDGEQTGYMVIEKVPNVEDTVRFLRRADSKQTNIFLVQVALAFAIAEETIAFTHNDAHLGNVLVRRLPRKEVIVYKYRDNTYRILTDFVVVIIDYGYARANIRYRKNGETRLAMYRTECPLNDKTYFQNQPCAISDFFRVLLSTFITQGSGTGPKVSRLYELLTGMKYEQEDMGRWSDIYFTVYPPPPPKPSRFELVDIIGFLYEEEPKEALENVPLHVIVTHDTPQRLNELIRSGNIEITNVLQYFEYVIGYASELTYPTLTDDQRRTIADRTMAYLYQLYHKREKKKIARLISSYCRLFAFFLLKETDNLREENVLLEYRSEFYNYMKLFQDTEE